MTVTKIRKWTEREFERWFEGDNAKLPGVGKVLVIAKHPPVGRMIDIVALDRTGALVLIEVKNESATRTAIGQVIEYLARYEAAELTDFAEDFEAFAGRNLYQAAKDAFGCGIDKLSARRRVFIAAQSFSYHANVCCRFLSDAFKAQGVSFELLRITSTPGAEEPFTIDAVDQIPLKPAKVLRDFVRTASGRLYYILEPGPTPVVWSIGEFDQDDRLVLASRPSLKRRSKSAMPLIRAPVEVDVSETGSAWEKQRDPSKQALLLGVVAAGTGRRVALARFVNGQYEGLQFKDDRVLRGDWQTMTQHSLPDWSGLAKLVAKARLARNLVAVR